MKIVHLMGYFVPELGYQEYYLAKKHKEMGHDVYVIASDMFYPSPNIETVLKEAGAKDASRKRKAGFSVIDGIKLYRLPHIIEYTDFILCYGLKKTLAKIKPDIVFAHESRQGLSSQGAFYKRKLNFKLIVDQHDFYHKIHGLIKPILRDMEYHFFRKFLVNYNLKNADRIIAVTQATKDFLVKVHKVLPEKIELIELGTDTDIFYPRELQGKHLRKMLHIKNDEVILLFAGIIVRRKKVEELINVFSELCRHYKIKLVIVGDGEKAYVSELKSLAKRLGVDDKIIFTGFIKQQDLPDYYSMADIGVWHANNSMSILDGMACKLPVVIADWKLSQYASHNNGFKVPLGNKSALEDSLVRLIKSKKLREAMGRNSIKAIKEHYSYDVIAKNFLK